jgi:DNA-binding CsgD family transcriptional regulator
VVGRQDEDVPVAEDRDPFVGRTGDLSALRKVLADVRSRQPQTVLLTGPAGIGKTSLVEQFLAGLDDTRLLRASGEQWEALVAYGVIDQILRAAGVRAGFLLAGRTRALAPEEPVSVGALLLESIESLEQQSPVVLLIDDAQWADVDSLRALLFALRRLVADRVLTLLVARDEDVMRLPEGLRRLTSGPTGRSISVNALDDRSIKRLATALGVPQLPMRTIQRLREHTGGNPLYVRALLTELPADRWHSWEPVLPAPGAFATQIVGRLSACSPTARALVEACSVLGVRSSLPMAAALAEVDDPVAALEEADAVGLLHSTAMTEIWDVTFPHPLVQAAVYEHVAPTSRVRLHRSAAELLDDTGAALRHRVAAATPPDPELADDLDAFARLRTSWGAWASAASALVEASRLSDDRELREQRLLRAIDAIVSAGDLPQASVFARDVGSFAPGPLRDAALGYLAVLRGRVAEAESLLTMGWERAELAADPHLGALLALRWTLHSVGRLRGAEVVDWSRRAMALVPGDGAVRLEAEALLGLGLGLMGQVPDGLAAYESVLTSAPGDVGSIAGRVSMARSWLQLVVDDVDGLPQTLSEVAPEQLRGGSIRIAVWSYVWLSRAHYLLGNWDEAADAAGRAVALLEETGHEWLRPLARWVAVAIVGGRGDWAAAQEHVRRASAATSDCELMIVASALAGAELAWTRGDHQAVLTALEPVLALPEPRQGIDEPGFWPWQHLYGDALIGVGRLDDAAAFLAPHEDLAAERKRRSSIARLTRVRGRLEAASGRMDAAEAAFRHSLDQFHELPLPFERALTELSYGQMLRRWGHRRAAVVQLEAARERFEVLDARPFIERCTTELEGSGLPRANRGKADPARLTRQEAAVARRAASGMSNRDIASDMSISAKTVQFHVSNVYAKLGVRSRLQLANRLRAQEQPAPRTADGG